MTGGLSFAIPLAFYLLASCGIGYSILALWQVCRFKAGNLGGGDFRPPATVLKPLCGDEPRLYRCLRSFCDQDYPEYQLVFGVCDRADPAVAAVDRLRAEFPDRDIALVVDPRMHGANPKVSSLINMMGACRHDVLVISDSDMRLAPDYLRVIVEPLADPDVGCVCTPYRAIDAERWYEKLELLTINADFVPNLVFTDVLGLLSFGLGASMCFRRSDLAAIGGFAAFRDYLAEDYIMAERFKALGRRIVLAPYFVDMEVDLKSVSQSWQHQLYWDQNTRAMRPSEYFATIIVRAVPFALIYMLLTGFSPTGLNVLVAAAALRMVCAAFVLGGMMRDREGLAALWLLPARDVMALAIWCVTILKRDFVRRGQRFALLADGRIVPRPAR